MSSFARSVLAQEFPLGTASQNDDLVAAGHDGMYVGPALVADQLTDFLASLVASAVVAPWLVSTLSGRILLVGGLAAVLACLVVGATLAVTNRWAQRTSRALGAIYDHISSVVNGRLEIVASGRDGEFIGSLASHLDVWQREASASAIRIGFAARAPFLVALVFCLLAFLGSATGQEGSASSAVAKIMVLASTMPIFAGLVRSPFDVVRSIAILDPFLAVLDRGRTAPESGTRAPPSLPQAIEWDSVSYRYPYGERPSVPVIRDFSARWPAGTTLAIRGPNGSGKSTVLRLLLGIGRPEQGHIIVGGFDLSKLDIRRWRTEVAYLPQQPFFPQLATIREAIRFTATDVVDADLKASLDRVALWHTLAEREPDDPLSVRASTLSAGQRQRLALARVLCQKRRIVVLDEPEANLDVAGVALVGELVRELAKEHMVAFAAHTPDLIDTADHVVVLGASNSDVSVSRTNGAGLEA